MNTQKINETLIRRNQAVFIPTPKKTSGHLDFQTVSTLQMKILQYGYVLSMNAMKEISAMSKKQVKKFADELTGALQTLTRADLPNITPFYPNFPEEVAHAVVSDLFAKQLVHYLGVGLGVSIIPNPEQRQADPLPEGDLRKKIVLDIFKEELSEFGREILTSKLSISPEDAQDAQLLMSASEDPYSVVFDMLVFNEKNINAGLPSIGNRENIAYAFDIARKFDEEKFSHDFTMFVSRNVTDILRYAVLLSGGSPSLARDPKLRFKSFSRPERFMLMNALDTVIDHHNDDNRGRVIEDFNRHRNLWKRFTRSLHFGDYKKQFPETVDFISARLSSNDKVDSFASQFELLVNRTSINHESRVQNLINLTKIRPGEFARRLNHLLTIAETKEMQLRVVEAFAEVAPKVSTTILWQMLPLFDYRNSDEHRVIFPKGEVAHAKVLAMPRKAYGKSVIKKVKYAIVDALMINYGELDKLGKVYIDPALEDYMIPVGMRTSSTTNKRAMTRGTRVPLSGKTVERFYVWWKDPDHKSQDVDLSVVVLDKNYNSVGNVNYQNLRLGDTILHSGDIIAAPQGAAEYVDIDMNKIRTNYPTARYIAMSVQVYSGIPFDEFECYAGTMGRDFPQSGETFDARTLTSSFDLRGRSMSVVPMVIDIEEECSIWTDISGKSSGQFGNVNNRSGMFGEIVRGATLKRYSSLYDLFIYHGLARGELVENQSEADTVYAVIDGVPNVSQEKIISKMI